MESHSATAIRVQSRSGFRPIGAMRSLRTPSATRGWQDVDGNASPFASAGDVQVNELTNSTSTPSFGRNIASSTLTDPAALNGWGVRGYNWEFATSIQHELAPKWSVGAAYY